MIELMLDKSRKGWLLMEEIDRQINRKYRAQEVDDDYSVIELDLKGAIDKLWDFIKKELPEWVKQARWHLIDGVLVAYYNEQPRLFPLDFISKLKDREQEEKERELVIVEGVKMKMPFYNRVELECKGVTITQSTNYYFVLEGKRRLLKLRKGMGEA
jgi:hypothetical protein